MNFETSFMTLKWMKLFRHFKFGTVWANTRASTKLLTYTATVCHMKGWIQLYILGVYSKIT